MLMVLAGGFFFMGQVIVPLFSLPANNRWRVLLTVSYGLPLVVGCVILFFGLVARHPCMKDATSPWKRSASLVLEGLMHFIAGGYFFLGIALYAAEMIGKIGVYPFGDLSLFQWYVRSLAFFVLSLAFRGAYRHALKQQSGSSVPAPFPG
jgi:hypothetical protein